MSCYRIFLLRQGKITAHHEFGADNDARACRAAALAFDACTDHCDDFELWFGVQLIASRAGLRTHTLDATADAAFAERQAMAADAGIERIAVAILEAAMKTCALLRDSQRLNARLNVLRPAPAGGR